MCYVIGHGKAQLGHTCMRTLYAWFLKKKYMLSKEIGMTGSHMPKLLSG